MDRYKESGGSEALPRRPHRNENSRERRGTSSREVPIPSYDPGFVFNTNFALGSVADQDQTFPGLLDEVEVFNRAVTAAEVAAIYNAGSAGKVKPVS